MRDLDAQLQAAILAGCSDDVRVLTSLGADVNAADVHGTTLFMLACAHGNTPMLRWMCRPQIPHRVQPRLCDQRGRTALFYAVERGDQSIVECLIYSLGGTGVYPERLGVLTMHDHAGQTAEDLALALGHTAIAELLEGDRIHMEWCE